MPMTLSTQPKPSARPKPWPSCPAKPWARTPDLPPVYVPAAMRVSVLLESPDAPLRGWEEAGGPGAEPPETNPDRPRTPLA